MYNAIIICLDKRDGLSFGGRRLSRDAKIFEDIQKDFGAVALSNDISLDFLPEAKESPAVFCEVEIPGGYLEGCNKVIIYRFDRAYPFDMSLPESFYDNFKLFLRKYGRKNNEKSTIATYRFNFMFFDMRLLGK